MNHLAHCVLSCHDHDLLLGNFAADFINKSEADNIALHIKKGIELHKKIDYFTDQHPSTLFCKGIFLPIQRKYSAVVVDVIFDYFLIKNWSKYSEINLTIFVENVYTLLAQNINLFPLKLQSYIPKMIGDNFLLSCQDEQRLRKTFTHLEKRLKYENKMHHAVDTMLLHEEIINHHFILLFDDLMAFTKYECLCD